MIDALQRTTGYAIVEGRLDLLDGNGEVVAELEAG